ncbi:hypothetical protein IF2G_07299 [Cordyceps javanica]|nr:hypothetical protein IF2G_07299 [Cordyceps javanica]
MPEERNVTRKCFQLRTNIPNNRSYLLSVPHGVHRCRLHCAWHDERCLQWASWSCVSRRNISSVTCIQLHVPHSLSPITTTLYPNIHFATTSILTCLAQRTCETTCTRPVLPSKARQ